MRRFSTLAMATIVMVAIAIPVAAAVAGQTHARTLTAVLAGDAQVTPNDSAGVGLAEVTADVRRGVLCFELTVSGIEPQEPGPGVGAAHIHTGTAGTNGGSAVGSGQGVDDFTTGCLAVDDTALLRDLIRHPRNYYVNVHTAAFPAGEIGGQLSK